MMPVREKGHWNGVSNQENVGHSLTISRFGMEVDLNNASKACSNSND